MSFEYRVPDELVLGTGSTTRVPLEDQLRQRREAEEILARLRTQPGVVLADEVGMGKTFVALTAALSVARQARSGPVVIMVPANLVDKWIQDLRSFCQLYAPGLEALPKAEVGVRRNRQVGALLFGVARDSVEFMRLLDDPESERCEVIFLAQGAMSRGQADKWVRLAFIAEAFRRHGRRTGLARVRASASRYIGRLLYAVGEERSHQDDTDLWRKLLRLDPERWMDFYNAGVRSTSRQLQDNPVPKPLVKALPTLDVSEVADALEGLPIRESGDTARMEERLTTARKAIREAEARLWRDALGTMSWRSPLLILDEAHHLKNPETTLAQMFQELGEVGGRVGAGAIYAKFDRMCFLTATPFQLGHRELINVLRRFGGVRWRRKSLGERSEFEENIKQLETALDQTQRRAIRFQRAWSRLDQDDVADVEDWQKILASPRDAMPTQLRDALNAFDQVASSRAEAQNRLAPWIIRHNKGVHWEGGAIVRRNRRHGTQVLDLDGEGGLPVPGHQLVPFFLAARSAVLTDKDVLGEALASSYEAFRLTRAGRRAERDEGEAKEASVAPSVQVSSWHLSQFDLALRTRMGRDHPKIAVTVQRAVDLWEQSEKVLVFAFYLKTCHALRYHISQEIERRLYERAAHRFGVSEDRGGREMLDRLIERVQSRFFDDAESRGRGALDVALKEILQPFEESLHGQGLVDKDLLLLTTVMRRFLRVPATLLRSFPIERMDQQPVDAAVHQFLEHADASGLSQREKLTRFLHFLDTDCSPEERSNYLDALGRMDTGAIRIELAEGYEKGDPGGGGSVLPNVRMATGGVKREVRAQLMRGFNTPFFPEILVCSEVMGEGVDLHRACRHVIHHDLAWNPSQIEQRTGRVDRLGCKAEGRHPIVVDMPYIAGMTDERQFKVMSDREQWFKVVMGQEEVAKLVSTEGKLLIPLPEELASTLSFRLGL